MNVMVSCPICEGRNFKEVIECKDFTATNETFKIQRCEGCDLILTNPQPTPSELSRYYQSNNYISHSNRSNTVIDSIYKVARKFTLQWKIDLIKKHISTNRSVLDYGCGTGHFLAECKRHGFTIAGVEPSDNARQIAENTTTSKIHSDIANVPGTYGIITLWHVLEHISDLNKVVKILREKLDQNATLIIAVPNINSWESSKYKSFWAAYDTPRHLWHFSQRTMTALMQKHGLKIASVHPMKLDAYYVSLLSEKYQNNNKLTFSGVAKAMVNGTRSNIKGSTTTEYSSLIYVVKNEN